MPIDSTRRRSQRSASAAKTTSATCALCDAGATWLRINTSKVTGRKRNRNMFLCATHACRLAALDMPDPQEGA